MNDEKASPQRQKSGTDSFVTSTSENATLNLKIKEEFENSCGLVHQINETTCGINTCQQDAIKFNDLCELKVIDLKRLETELKTLLVSRDRIRGNIDYLKKQHELILIGEEQKQKECNSVIANYGKMIQTQRDIVMSRPLMKKRNLMLSRVDRSKIELAVLRERIDGWHRKEHEMKKIQRMRLNNAVVSLAHIIIKKRIEPIKNPSVLIQPSENKKQLGKLIEFKQKQTSFNLGKTIVMQKRISPTNVSKISNIPQSLAHVKQPSNILSNKLGDRRDPSKSLQRLNVFKTPPSPSVLPAKSRQFSSPNLTLRNSTNHNFESSLVKRQSNRSPAICSPVNNLKRINISDKCDGHGLDSPKSISIRSVSAKNLLVNRPQNCLNPEICFDRSNNEMSAISRYDSSYSNDESSPISLSRMHGSDITSRISRSCRSNSATPVNARSVGSQKREYVSPLSRIPVLKSPRSLELSRIPVRFSPVSRGLPFPAALKSDVYQIESRKSPRTPELMQKKIKEKQLPSNKSSTIISSSITENYSKKANPTSTPGKVTPLFKFKGSKFENSDSTRKVTDVNKKFKPYAKGHNELTNVKQDSYQQFSSIHSISPKENQLKKPSPWKPSGPLHFSGKKLINSCSPIKVPEKPVISKREPTPRKKTTEKLSTPHRKKLKNDVSSKLVSELDIFTEGRGALKLSDLMKKPDFGDPESLSEDDSRKTYLMEGREKSPSDADSLVTQQNRFESPCNPELSNEYIDSIPCVKESFSEDNGDDHKLLAHPSELIVSKLNNNDGSTFSDTYSSVTPHIGEWAIPSASSDEGGVSEFSSGGENQEYISSGELSALRATKNDEFIFGDVKK